MTCHHEKSCRLFLHRMKPRLGRLSHLANMFNTSKQLAKATWPSGSVQYPLHTNRLSICVWQECPKGCHQAMILERVVLNAAARPENITLRCPTGECKRSPAVPALQSWSRKGECNNLDITMRKTHQSTLIATKNQGNGGRTMDFLSRNFYAGSGRVLPVVYENRNPRPMLAASRAAPLRKSAASSETKSHTRSACGNI